MSNEQKLREALQAISHIDDTTNHSVDASAALDRIGQIARQALALPTADHLPDATKMIETAAPVGEREAFEREMSKPPFEFCMDRWPDDGAYAWPGGYAAYHTQCAWDAWQARAALALPTAEQVDDINVAESFTSAAPDMPPQLRKIHPLDFPLEVFLADLTTRPAKIIRAEMLSFTRTDGAYDIEPPLTVRHLCMFSRNEMRKWPQMGKKSLNEIEETLRDRGLHLWENHDERSLRLLREHKDYFK